MVALVAPGSARVKWRGLAGVFTTVNPYASKVVRSATRLTLRGCSACRLYPTVPRVFAGPHTDCHDAPVAQNLLIKSRLPEDTVGGQ